MKIFVGYAREDARWLETIRLAISPLGFVELMIDKGAHKYVEKSGLWRRDIRGMVQKSHLVMVLVSRNWAESKQCWDEFEEAEALGKLILPIAIDPDFPIEEWPDAVNINDAVVLADGPGKREEFDRLRAILQRVRADQRKRFTMRSAKYSAVAAAVVVLTLAVSHFLPPLQSKDDGLANESYEDHSQCGNLAVLSRETVRLCANGEFYSDHLEIEGYCKQVVMHRFALWAAEHTRCRYADPFKLPVPRDQLVGKRLGSEYSGSLRDADCPGNSHSYDASNSAPWKKYCRYF